MCNPIIWWAAGAAVAVIGSEVKSRAANQAGEDEASDMEYQGDIARDQGQAEASRIRRAGRRQRGETVGALAASGVKVGEGSALDAERTVMQDYEQDAAISILNGERQGRVYDQRAAARRRAGQTSGLASLLGGAGSVLGSGAGMFGG